MTRRGRGHPHRFAIEARAFEQRYPRNTGIGNYVLSVVRALGEIAPDARWFVLTVGRVDDDIAALAAAPNVHLRRLRLPGRVFRWVQRHTRVPLFELLAPRADAFLFTNFATYPLRRAPFALVVYDLSFLLVPETFEGGYREFLERTVPEAITEARTVIVLSDAVKHELMEQCGTAADKIVVARPGVDRTLFRPMPADGAAVRARLGLPDRYFVFVGTLQPRKNVMRVVAAYRALPADVRSSHALVLVGMKGWKDDDLHVEIGRAAAAGERIHGTGYVATADLPAVYAGATALVWPALYEGFGMPILEAMACGTPVITSDRSAMPEAAGGAAVLVDPTDVDAIAAAMHRVACDDDVARDLVARGLARAARADWHDTAAAVLGALERASGDHRAG